MSAAYSIANDVSLRDRNTLRIAATARHLVTLNEASALPLALQEPRLRGLPLLVLGAGSNVLLATERFEGVVLHLAFDGVAIAGTRAEGAIVRVEAAHGWDAFVDWTLAQGLAGLENLALIPG